MATLVKTVQTELLAIQELAAGAQLISTILNVATKLAATIFIDFAPIATTAAPAQTEIRIEGSEKAADNDTWRVLTTFLSGAVVPDTNAVDGTEAAGSTVIEETTTTGLANGTIVYFDNTTTANSEWSRVVSIVGSTSFTIQDGLKNAQTGSTWFNRGEHFVAFLDLTSITRLRVVVNNNVGASAKRLIAVRVAAITADSIG